MPSTRAGKRAADAPDVHAILAQAQLPQRIVRLCVRGDLQAELDQAAARLLAGTGADDKSSKAAAKDAEAEITRITTEMAAATVAFRMRALSNGEFRDLVAGNPPRKGNELDQSLGYNLDAVTAAYLRVGCLEPVLSAEEWDEMEARLTPHQRGELVAAVDALTHTAAIAVRA